MEIIDKFLRLTFLCLLLLPLTSCAVHLVSDYDDQIDTGLTQANTDITAFVLRMSNEAGTSAGEYSQNREFYTSEAAKLSSIRVRAEAHRALNSCPSSAIIQSAVKTSVPPDPPAGPTVASAQELLAKLPQDDCEVVLISLIQSAFADLERFHNAQGPKGIPASAQEPILKGGIGSLIRSGIQIEVALKSGKIAGGN